MLMVISLSGMTYTRAQSVQIDAWELLGNSGWNWENLLPYYKKSEGFQVPTLDQIDDGADYFIRYHGEDGPVKVGWPNAMTNSSMLPVLDETLSGLGVPYNREVNDGSMVGLSSHPDTIDRDANIRQDAARAYYWPYQDRPNLKIISNTQANKIIWAEGSQSEAIAIGVEVTGVDGVEVMHASKEVILSAGSLRSPLLLELSGIGNPDILKRFDIPLKVNISTVGENLQDQTNNGLSYDGRQSWFGSPTFAVLPSIDHVYGDNVSSIASLVNSSLADYAKAVSNYSNGAVLEANVQAAFQLQYDLVFKSRVPFAEIVFIPIAHSFMTEYWPLLPFSRGSVHMNSSDPSHPPSINPNFFMFERDLNSQADVARYIRKIFNASPLRSLVGDELSPGLDLLPEDAPESKWASWVMSTCKVFFYPTYSQPQMLERF